MSQAEELLNGMSEEVPVHTHPVPDTDAYFVIDPITKQIENTSRKNTVIMQYTHNSERLTFELPRYIDGHDMLECTSVTVNANNIEAVESDGVEEVEPRVNPDAPDITDLRIHPNDPEKALCSWLISRNSTQLAGILSFHIEFKCVDSNGNVVYEWSTDNYDEIEVRARKKNGEAAVVEHTDLLEQWRTRIFGAGDSVMANIAAEGEAQVAAVKAESETQQEAVELKGAQTLDSIPEDYTEVDAMAEEALRTKAGAITLDVDGSNIFVNNSSNDRLLSLRVFGKSTQNGTPSPDNPIEIVSIENPRVSVLGTNLLPYPQVGKIVTVNGITYEYEGNGIYHIYGTYNSTTTEMAACHIDIYSPIRRSDKYTLSAKLISGTVGMKYHFFVGLCSDTVPFRNWFSIPIEKTTEAGIILSDTRTPESALSDATQLSRFWIYSYNPNVEAYTTDFRVQLWLEKNDKSTEYTAYTKQTLYDSRTLPGIPVTSGGNYTDSDGQQWICDEVDLERGVYVQRLNTLVLDGSSDETWGRNDVNPFTRFVLNRSDIKYGSSRAPFVCSHFTSKDITSDRIGLCFVGTTAPGQLYFYPEEGLDSWEKWCEWLAENPTTVMYELAIPVETPLTAEEITAFKALRTNYLNTTILNDAGAWMSVKYNADTKSYVDKPKTLRLTDTSTGVVYELKVVDGNLTVVPVQ